MYHLPTLAQTTIAENVRQGRHTYPTGGVMQADFDVMAGDQFILPGKSKFHDSKEMFRRALGKDWNSNRNNYWQRDPTSNLPQPESSKEHNEAARSDLDETPKPNFLVKESLEPLSGISNPQPLRDYNKNEAFQKGKSPV